MIQIKSLASSSKGNAHWVTDGQTQILIDCGLPFKEIQRRMNFETSNLAGCLISHSHADHCKAAKDLIKAGIDIYLSAETAEEIEVNDHRVNSAEPKKPFQVGSWNILPLDMVHDVYCLGFLMACGLGKLIYLTDSAYCKYIFTGLTHIMVECNYSKDILERNISSGSVDPAQAKRLLRTHFGLEAVKEFLKANDLSTVQEIHLLHLSDGNSDEVRFKKEIQGLTGKVVVVSHA